LEVIMLKETVLICCVCLCLPSTRASSCVVDPCAHVAQGGVGEARGGVGVSHC
jgi:hypothetical protein